MAPTQVISATTTEESAFISLKASLAMVDTTIKSDSMEAFNPKLHLSFKPPPEVYSMSDIKLPDSPISGFAVSEPFQLFTPEAVRRMRAEIFKPEVMDNFQYSSNLAQCQLRGYARK